MKLSTVFIIFGVFIIFQFSDAKRVLSYTSIACSGSNKTVVISECYIKAVSKRQSGLNIVLDFIKKVSYDFGVKFGKVYRSLAKDDIDICKFLSGTQTSVMKFVMNLIKRTLPKNLLEPCPKFGCYKLFNVTADLPSFRRAAFPNVSHSVFMHFHNSDDKNISSIQLYAEGINYY
ncbi:CLUMA_CG002474, isoform A [Clunio marinus]|uniref:CLUMA_CG002474, isoform A n=1 Tax=Clunio marinus TaxID=568069 RepID=A0A1J1HQU2_9DIPT|nr:CLUMA_CG002474, isoform A [Clunio marinus]